MALRALKRPEINQSSFLEAPATSDIEWQKKSLAELTDDERMEYEERAAIMEFDGGLSKEESERIMLKIVLSRRVTNNDWNL